MKRHAAGLTLAALLTTSFASVALAEDRVFTVENVQASVPVGVTVMVKKVTVGADATVVNLVASFDSRQTNRINLNETNAFLDIGNGQKLHMRQLRDNPYLIVMNGQSLEGDLVFPGQIPSAAKSVTLVFNEGSEGDDSSAPGVTLNIPLPDRQ